MSRQRLKLIDIEGVLHRYCASCKILKAVTEYYAHSTSSTGITSYCKECSKKKWSEGGEKYRTSEYRRNNYLKNTYGINDDDYQLMYVKQKGKCAICEKEFTNLNIDHCHKSTKIRELLCENCNLGIGNFQEDKNILEKAIAYLRKWDIQND